MSMHLSLPRSRSLPRTARPAPRHDRRPFRPAVEALEDRCLPSVVTVTDPGDDGANTLRGRIAAAAAGDTINFAPGITAITLTTGGLPITQNGLTITGPGAGLLTVAEQAGGPAVPVFNINPGGAATISGLTVTGGLAFVGGGFFNFGQLALDRVVVTGNSAAAGGGLFNGNGGTANVSNSTFTNNTATGTSGGGGGAIDNAVGTMLLINCTLSGNTAAARGGAILNSDMLTVSNCTLVGNTSHGEDGAAAILNSGTALILDSTIVNNKAAGPGHGAAVVQDQHPGGAEGPLTLTSTIVAGNAAIGGRGNGDVFGDISRASSFDLIGNGSDQGGIANGSNKNQVGGDIFPAAPVLDPRLGPLQDNGGPTQTMALLPGSPALNAGTNNDAPAGDQRGFLRTVGSASDIGAFEFQPPATLTDTSGNPTTAVAGQPLTLTATVHATSPFPNNVPTGTVTFSTGTAFLGTATLSPSAIQGLATATLTVTAGKAGNLTFTATYSGDGNFGASQSPGPVVKVLGNSTPGVYEIGTGRWLLRNENSDGGADAGDFQYAGPGLIPVTGDWTGSGVSGIGVYQISTGRWLLKNTPGNGPPDFDFFYGGPGLIPVAGDWTGAGHAGVGVYEIGTGRWLLREALSAGGPDFDFSYGGPGLMPVAGDWTGAGHAGVGVYQIGTGRWLLREALSAGGPDFDFSYGGPGLIPVAGDWSAAGHAGVGVYQIGTGRWLLRQSNSAGNPDFDFSYGGPGLMPVVGDFDGAAQQQLAAGGEGPGAAPLPAGELPGVVAEALGRLLSAGVDPAVVAGLAAARYGVGALPAGELGLTDVAADRVTVSADAAGWGWYADAAAGDGAFAASSAGGPLAAAPGGPAAGREDLLSVVLHEMGHLAGLPDLPGGSGLMAEALGVGMRRTQALDAAFAGGLGTSIPALL